MILQVGVKALLKYRDGKYLLLKRSNEKYKKIVKGGWDIPGGRIMLEAGLIENLRREIKEETDLELNGEPKLVLAQDIFSKSEKTGEDKHVVRLTYLGEAKGDIKLDVAENTDYMLADIDEMKGMGDLDPYLKAAIESVFPM